MGTAFLLLAQVARQRQIESQRRAREAERRRRESAKRRKTANEEEKKSKYTYSSERTYSFEEHLIRLLEKSPEHLEYVRKLYEEASRIDVSDRRKIEVELDEVAEELLKQEAILGELAKKIEAEGITIDSKYFIEGVRIDQPGKLPFTHRVGAHKYNFIGFPILFNGIRVNRDDLANDGAEYEEAYAKERRENPDIEKKLKKDQGKLRRQERLYQMPFMGTYDRSERIEALKSEVFIDEALIKRIAEKKTALDTFRNFTPEQKKLIKEYLDQIFRIKEISDPIGDRIKTHDSIGQNYTRADAMRAKWERAGENLIKTGRVTQEQVDSFFDMIASELEKVQPSYAEGTSHYETSEKCLQYGGPLSWILKTKAIEYAREKHEKLLKERKTLDEAQSLVEKRDKQHGQTNTAVDSDKEEEGRGE